MGHYLELSKKVSTPKPTKSPVIQETFKRDFIQLAGHLRQRHYTTKDITRLQELAYKMDAAWEDMDYSTFKEVTNRMMEIQGRFFRLQR